MGMSQKVIQRGRVSPTLHDFPYRGEKRKCYHKWIVNVTPAGAEQCIHSCLYCYARDAVYSVKNQGGLVVYRNLAGFIEKELEKLELCPPLSISNVTDPCQKVPELRRSVKELVEVLCKWGVSYHLTTKGDPSFIEGVQAFPGLGNFFLSVTIEGPPEVLELLSPSAPEYDKRLDALGWASRLGLHSQVRLDPVIPPLWRALYGNGWRDRAARLLADFVHAGAAHVVSSTGRFTAHTLARLGSLCDRLSGFDLQSLKEEYSFDRSGVAAGYMLHPDMRRDFHLFLRDIAHDNGITYAVCQELDASAADSPGLQHCEAFHMPFSRRIGPRSFAPIPGCTSNCHISCQHLEAPPCGQPDLAYPRPYTPAMLKKRGKQERSGT